MAALEARRLERTKNLEQNFEEIARKEVEKLRTVMTELQRASREELDSKDASLWIDEPIILRAFHSLLSTRQFFGVAPSDPLLALLKESVQDQQEVTNQLGNEVRDAVEVLIQAFDRLDQDSGRTLLKGLDEEPRRPPRSARNLNYASRRCCAAVGKSNSHRSSQRAVLGPAEPCERRFGAGSGEVSPQVAWGRAAEVVARRIDIRSRATEPDGAHQAETTLLCAMAAYEKSQSPHNSRQGTTCSISSRNTCRRDFSVYRSKPFIVTRLLCCLFLDLI
jgi:hypothetical protein